MIPKNRTTVYRTEEGVLTRIVARGENRRVILTPANDDGVLIQTYRLVSDEPPKTETVMARRLPVKENITSTQSVFSDETAMVLLQALNVYFREKK
jgi:hypothetical protein